MVLFVYSNCCMILYILVKNGTFSNNLKFNIKKPSFIHLISGRDTHHVSSDTFQKRVSIAEAQEGCLGCLYGK